MPSVLVSIWVCFVYVTLVRSIFIARYSLNKNRFINDTDDKRLGRSSEKYLLDSNICKDKS